MRRAHLIAFLLVVGLVPPTGAGADQTTLGAPRRVTTPGEGTCPAEGEPEIAVTSAGTWVAYNDLHQCPVLPGFTRFTGLQLLPRGGGPARFVPLPPHPAGGASFGDPDLAPDPRGDGGVYLLTMHSTGNSVAGLTITLDVLRVTPGGVVERLPDPTEGFRSFGVDKPFLATDTGPDSPFRGRVYAVWDDSGIPWRTYLRAWDGERWLPPVEVLVEADGHGDLAVAPDGTLAVAVETDEGVSVALSTDGGQTIGPLRPALSGGLPGRTDPSCAFNLIVGYRQRVIKSVRVAYDSSGALHVVAALGVRFPPGPDTATSYGSSTIQYAVSQDGQSFVQSPVAVTGRSQWTPAIAATPNGGVAVSWLEMADVSGTRYDAWLSVRPRGAAAFGEPVRLSPATSLLVNVMEAYGSAFCYGIGDYIGLTPSRRGVVAAWPTTDGVARPGLDSDLLVREAVIR